MRVLTEFISFKIRTSGGLFRMRWWALVFHKRRTFLDSQHLSQKGLCSIQLLFILLFSLFCSILSGVRLSPLGTAATTGLLYQPQIIDDGDCGAIGGMKIGRGNLSSRRKPALAPLCPPQIPHDQSRARTRAAAVGSQRLTAWAMARPTFVSSACIFASVFRRSHSSPECECNA
jgi:hypothetical protein